MAYSSEYTKALENWAKDPVARQKEIDRTIQVISSQGQNADNYAHYKRLVDMGSSSSNKSQSTSQPKTSTTTPSSSSSSKSSTSQSDPYQQSLNYWKTNQQAAQDEWRRAMEVTQQKYLEGTAGADQLAHINKLAGILGYKPYSSLDDMAERGAWGSTSGGLGGGGGLGSLGQQDLINALLGQLNSGLTPERIFSMIQQASPQLPQQKVLTYAEALDRAKGQLNPLYNDAQTNMIEGMDKSALQRGFYGQMPVDAEKRYKAQELEGKRGSAIAELANMLVGQSESSASQQQQLAMQQQQQQLNSLMSALNASGSLRQSNIANLLGLLQYQDSKDFRDKQYQDQRSDVEFNKGLTLAQITGYYEGKPTTDYQKFLFDMGMKEEQAKLEAKKFQDTAARGWASIQNSRDSLAHRIAQDNYINTQNKEKYLSDINKKAHDMTVAYFKSIGKGTTDMFGNTNSISPAEFDAKMQEYAQYLAGVMPEGSLK